MRVRLRVACISAFDIPCAGVSVADFVMGRIFSQCQLYIHPCVYPMELGSAIEEKEVFQSM